MRSVNIVLLVLVLFSVEAIGSGNIVDVSPVAARPGDVLWVTVTGSGTAFGQGSGTTASLRIPETGASLAPVYVHAVNATHVELELQIPFGQEIGYYDVVVEEMFMGGETTTWQLEDGFYIGYPFDCGDIDRGGTIDVDDLKAMIAYIYITFPTPIPPERGDLNCDRKINILDIALMVKYLYRGGEHPCALCP